MAALFSSQAGGTDSGSGSAHLLQFRAGKMSMRDKTVTADKRKGLLYITRGEDMLMHLCWKDRGTGAVEDDLILFPDDAEFLHVAQCTTGRVYLLRFKDRSRKLFFWMQEPKTDKDTEHATKVNELLNNPPEARGSGGGGQSAQEQMLSQVMGLGPGAEMAEMGQALGGMDQAQMMHLLQSMMGGSGGLDPSQLMGLSGLGSGRSGGSATAASPPVTTPPVTAAPAPATPSTPAQPNIALSDLQNILAGMNFPAGQGPSAGAAQGGAQGPGIDLEEVLSREEVRVAAEASAAALLPHLPSPGPGELGRSLRSPQFRQAAGTFGLALQSGQLAPVLRQFHLPDSAVTAAAQGDLEQFAASMEGGEASGRSAKPEEGTETPEKKEPPPKKEKKDGDEMDLD